MPTEHPTSPRATVRAGLLAALALMALTAPLASHAVDLSYSGFGTVGWAQSDQASKYQRFIDEQGTLKRDSVLGGQVDARLSPEWSATVQATLTPSLSHDDKLSLQASWAFLSWRPNNDWLLRAGKQRIPLFLNTENRDVGQTYDFLRLPAEVYAVAPTTDFTGLSASRTWLSDTGEWTLDAYTGRAKLSVRSSSRDMGPSFLSVETQASGASLTLKMDSAATFHTGLYRARTRRNDGQPLTASFPYVATPPFGGYYQVDNAIPGPGVGQTPHIVNDVVTVGADIEVAPHWRVVSELARIVQHKSDVGANNVAGYLAVFHQMDRLTPYVSIARLRSLGSPVRTAQALDASALPSFIPGADQLNAAQRIAADSIPVYDQTSLAFGMSYALTPMSKVKGEWMRTRVGLRSAMVDSPPGGEPVNHQLIDVLSLSYSFAF